MTRLLVLLALLVAACAAPPPPEPSVDVQDCYAKGGHVHTDGRGKVICTFPRTY